MAVWPSKRYVVILAERIFQLYGIMSTLTLLLIQVIWKKYLSDSSGDHGSLVQLFTVIKRLPAAKKPKKDMNACTDALFTVLKSHILAFACQELGIESIDSDITNPTLKSISD